MMHFVTSATPSSLVDGPQAPRIIFAGWTIAPTRPLLLTKFLQCKIVWFRQGQEDAVLDLPRVRAPKLMTVQGLTLPGPLSDAGTNAFTVTSRRLTRRPALYFGASTPYFHTSSIVCLTSSRSAAAMTRSDTGFNFQAHVIPRIDRGGSA